MNRNALCFRVGVTIAFCLLIITSSSEHHSGLFTESAQAQATGAAQQPEPTLMVAGKFTGVNEPEGIKLTAETASFKYVVQISTITNQEVKDLRIEVAPFTGPNSAQTTIDWKVNNESGAKPVTVAGLSSIPLELSATLPLAGAYSSNIWLIYNQRRWPIGLTVTRTRAAPSVEILGLAVVQDSAFFPSENAYLSFDLQENAGKPVLLNLPTVTELNLIQSDKTKLQAHYDTVQVECVKDCAQIGNSLEIGAGKTAKLKLTVVNLRDSGEYSGKVRVSGSDGAPLDATITILRKKSGWVAGLLVALGVFISFALRHYASTVRPRLILQREVVALKEEINELKRTHTNLTTDEQEALDRLNNQTQDILDDIAIARAGNVNQKIKNVKSKLEIFPRWVQERGRVDTLRPVELQQEFRVELDKIKTFMNVETVTDELLQQARTTLDQIAPRMKAKVKEDLTNKLNAFKNEVNTLRNTASAAIQPRLSNEVDPEIERAEDLLRAEKLDDARTAYEKARLAFVRILGDELEASLPATTPPGFDNTGWQQLKDEVIATLAESAQATDPDKATKLYLRAYAQYLRGLTSKLQESINALQESIKQSTSISPADKGKYKQLLDDANTKLTTALTKISAGDMRGAAQDYAAARDVMVQVKQESSATGGAMSTIVSATGDAAAAVSPGAVPDPLSLPFLGAFTNPLRIATVRDITRRLGFLDLLFTVIILGIAVFLGLKLLWTNDPTWGGWDDYFSAVLWGLGLHQASGAAFIGLEALAAKFGGASTPNVTT